ncbi:MAG: OmpA family protein [Rhodanobacteraceae bacterium]|nr:OmpA family protein [Xanthomonadales bacterium]MCP5479080.1 OmpA family protein [Rhodanobacteraceae bacterium]HPF72331.1 OmpA family protein [Xanthomonadaceae bacterium]HRX98528.1 OmpA family protein [Xanthomonadaceae bacterium]
MNRFDVRRHLRGGIALALSTGLLVACAGSQQRPPELVRLENQLARLQSDPVVSAEAPKELQQAANAVRNLSEHGDGMKSRVFDHNVYMADRLLQIAEAEGQSRFARERIDTLSAERERLVAEARAKEADRARHEANMARRDANAALAQADADRRDAAMAREQAEAERREATLARQQAEAARAELRAMQDMIDDLQAKQTERGLVVTLGDVLFETDKAVLKPGAMHNLDKLVAALSEHPDTTVAIEGHTDSTGSDSYNMDLSRRRAESVVSYLVGQGIDRSRLSAKGLGEGYPVASNDTSAGRQQNRRVEMIIQNAAG